MILIIKIIKTRITGQKQNRKGKWEEGNLPFVYYCCYYKTLSRTASLLMTRVSPPKMGGSQATWPFTNTGTRAHRGWMPQSRECEAASPDLEITSSDSKPKAHPFHHATSRTPKIILTCNIGVTNILLELFSKYNTFNTKTLDFKLIRNYNKTSASQRNILEL